MSASLPLQVVDHTTHLFLLPWVGHIGTAVDSLLRLILVPTLLLIILLGLCYKQRVETGEQGIQCENQLTQPSRPGPGPA